MKLVNLSWFFNGVYVNIGWVWFVKGNEGFVFEDVKFNFIIFVKMSINRIVIRINKGDYFGGEKIYGWVWF